MKGENFAFKANEGSWAYKNLPANVQVNDICSTGKRPKMLKYRSDQCKWLQRPSGWK